MKQLLKIANSPYENTSNIYSKTMSEPNNAEAIKSKEYSYTGVYTKKLSVSKF